jgi:hypothetical protein
MELKVEAARTVHAWQQGVETGVMNWDDCSTQAGRDAEV